MGHQLWETEIEWKITDGLDTVPIVFCCDPFQCGRTKDAELPWASSTTPNISPKSPVIEMYSCGSPAELAETAFSSIASPCARSQKLLQMPKNAP